MKRNRVDYSGFSLRRLNDPRFSHAILLIGWIVYFALYFITENLIPAESCHVIHSRLDDLIPFREGFVLVYMAWYAFVFGSLAFTFFYDVESFRKMQTFIMITQGIAMLIYVLYPSRQDLRPEFFEHDNLLTAAVGFLYAFDTPTGVFPSLHVAYSIGIFSVFSKDRLCPWWAKALIGFFVFLVCLSVCYIKQHSVLDVFAAIPVCLIAEIMLYGKDYLGKWCRKI